MYRDDGRPASRFAKKAREDWTRLRGDVDAGRLDLLWLWESDRGSRELEDWAGLLNDCRRQGVLVHVATHKRTYDPRVGRDWRSLAEDGVDAAYASEKMSVNIRRTMAANAAKGIPHGVPPFGYRRKYDPETGALLGQEPHPEQAPVVREIVSRVAGGEPLVTITADLNERRVPAPASARWSRTPLRRIAGNPAYIGRRVHKGQTFAGDWEPLVEEATWHAARRILTDPARKVTRPGRAKYLLSYVATCSVCGDKLHAATHPRRPTNYRCQDRGCVTVVAEQVDQMVAELVVRRLASPDVYPYLTEPGDDQEVVAARAEVEVLQGRLSEHYDAAARGDLSAAGLAAMESRLRSAIAAAQHRADVAATPPVLRSLLSPDGDVRSRWDALHMAGRREVVRVLMDVAVQPARERGVNQFDPRRVLITWSGRHEG